MMKVLIILSICIAYAIAEDCSVQSDCPGEMCCVGDRSESHCVPYSDIEEPCSPNYKEFYEEHPGPSDQCYVCKEGLFCEETGLYGGFSCVENMTNSEEDSC